MGGTGDKAGGRQRARRPLFAWPMPPRALPAAIAHPRAPSASSPPPARPRAVHLRLVLQVQDAPLLLRDRVVPALNVALQAGGWGPGCTAESTGDWTGASGGVCRLGGRSAGRQASRRCRARAPAAPPRRGAAPRSRLAVGASRRRRRCVQGRRAQGRMGGRQLRAEHSAGQRTGRKETSRQADRPSTAAAGTLCPFPTAAKAHRSCACPASMALACSSKRLRSSPFSPLSRRLASPSPASSRRQLGVGGPGGGAAGGGAGASVRGWLGGPGEMSGSAPELGR